MILEIEPNPNCQDGSDMKMFQETGPAKAVSEIRYYRRGPEPFWCAVTGWSTEQGGRPCPALAQKIGDSGDGEAILIYGGNGGLRLKMREAQNAWSLSDTTQWGEPYLVYSDENDIQFTE